MIGIDAKLTGDMSAGLDALAKNVQEKVLFAGVATMAKVIYDEVKANVSGALAVKRDKDFVGPMPESPPGVVTGNLRDSIYRVYSPERSTGERKTYRVSWNKKKAPHGHLIEFGSSRAPAHPFLRPAFDHVKDAIKQGKASMSSAMDSIGGSE